MKKKNLVPLIVATPDTTKHAAAPPVAVGRRVRSADAVEREYERNEARRMRGSCSECGHAWRPRNPSTAVNRCPGCGIRGMVSYRRIEDIAIP